MGFIIRVGLYGGLWGVGVMGLWGGEMGGQWDYGRRGHGWDDMGVGGVNMGRGLMGFYGGSSVGRGRGSMGGPMGGGCLQPIGFGGAAEFLEDLAG